MAVKTLKVTGLLDKRIVFRISFPLPIAALNIPSFPPSLGSIPLPTLPSLPKLDLDLDLPQLAFKTPNIDGVNLSLPKIKTPTLPSLSLNIPSFPPSLGSIPLPTLPSLQVPNVSLDLPDLAFKTPSLPDVSFGLPKIKTPKFPTLALNIPSFPPSLGSLPLPTLPSFPSFPDLSVFTKLTFPYLSLDFRVPKLKVETRID